MDFKIESEDLYELLGIEFSCSTVDIKKAYRKKALSCHPDKNPDNPDAAAEFHKLSKILEVLTDESARKAYDRVLKGRKEAALRHKALDSKRQKFKEDLEARERQWVLTKSPEQTLKEEIERLRKDGSRQLQEEMDFMMEQIKAQKSKSAEEVFDSSKYRIKIKWNAAKHDDSNGGYSEELLNKFLLKYGDINVLVLSKKKGSALVEFKTKRAAAMAYDIEKGSPHNPLEMQWVTEPPCKPHVSSTIKESDYESVILTKLRQAEERKRLIAQMMAEDQDD